MLLTRSEPGAPDWRVEAAFDPNAWMIFSA